MKTFNTIFENKETLAKFCKKNKIPNSNKVLLQIFTGVLDKTYIDHLLEVLNELLPEINIIGSTTDGEIIDTDVLSHSTILSFSIFEETTIKIHTVKKNKSSYQMGKKLISKFDDIDNIKVAIVFTDGLSTNGEIFLEAFDDIAPNLKVAGGLAGDNGLFSKTFIFTKDNIEESGAIAATLYNPNLQVNTSFSFGWEEIGKELTITKAKENIVYTIDDIDATEIYKKYLGEQIGSELPATGIEFPLILNRNGDKIARAVVGKNDDGSLVFAGNINEGDKVHLGYGNIENILNNRFSLYHDLSLVPIESTFIYSCMARKRLLGDDIKGEIIPLTSISPVSGFFTYGEFYSCPNSACNSENHLFNETMTILTLSEKKEATQIIKDEINNNNSKQIKTIQALSHLISVTSKELHSLNTNLQEKVDEEVALNMQQSIRLLEQSKMASMGEMLANIAHQWRQPLNSISMEASSILLNTSLGMDLDVNHVNSKMDNIISKVDYLSNTIDTFRNFLKEEKEFGEVDLQERLNLVFEIVGTVLKDSHIKLIIEEKTQTPIKLNMVPGELDQVLINIINNAKDVLGERKIKHPWIKVITKGNHKEVLITIEDNAGGIPENIISRVFEPYFTTKHQSQGTGLGLHMSYKIITESFHGKIYVQNTQHGAKFHIAIPLVS